MNMLLALALACTPEAPIGEWLAGDLHVHSSLGSNDTDGLGTPDALGPAMEAAGLDFVFLTDHSNSQGSMDCADVEDCPNQGPEVTNADWPGGAWLASEISPVESLGTTFEPTGHTGCLPLDGASFPDLEAFIDRPPGAVTGGEGVAQCKDHSGFAILNHPYAAAGWIAYDWTSEDFDAVEVYNGTLRFDAWDAQGLAAWEERVSAVGGPGAAPVAVGGSDSHRWGTPAPGDALNPALGWPITWIHLREAELPIDAIAAGRVVIAEPGSALSFAAEGGRELVGPGESVEGPATLTITASSEMSGMVLEVRLVAGDAVYSEPLSGEVTATIEVERGAYYARIWPEGEVESEQGGVAISNPIWVE